MEKSLVVSVVVPLENVASLIGPFLRDLSSVMMEEYAFYEVILIDDCSEDSTGSVVADLLNKHTRIRYLRLSRSYGREVAVAAGLETAIGDFVVTVDPQTDPVEMIPQLVERCRNGNGILCGISSHPRQNGLLTRLATSLFHKYCREYIGIDYKENSTEFRVLSRQVVNAITRIRDRRRYLRVFAATLGYSQEFFSYQPKESLQREHTLFQRIEHALEIVIANSRHPLRVVSRIGLLLSMVNLAYAIYILFIYLFKRDVAAGWTTMSMQMTGMFFFLFLILAILCEYVGRILEETQDRPLYFVASEQTSSVLLENSIAKNILNEAN